MLCWIGCLLWLLYCNSVAFCIMYGMRLRLLIIVDCWSFGGCYFIVLRWIWLVVLIWFMLASMLIVFIDFGVL